MNNNDSLIYSDITRLRRVPTFDSELLHCRVINFAASYRRVAHLNMHERYGIEKISRIRKCKGKGSEIWSVVTGGTLNGASGHCQMDRGPVRTGGAAGLSLVFLSTRIRHSAIPISSARFLPFRSSSLLDETYGETLALELRE